MDIIAQVLVALRQVIRATDLHSRHLMKTTGLTAPQLLVLRELDGAGELSVSALARRISLSQGTVTSILDRLQARGLVDRERSPTDRRRVLLRLTPAAQAALARAPLPLQEQFVRRFEGLQPWEQHMILAALQRVAQLMNADRIDAAPVLAIGALDQREATGPAE
ncbi:MAG: MarR family winged helix-turn-helix transcriptional regulator [Pseudomonadota bacterium]